MDAINRTIKFTLEQEEYDQIVMMIKWRLYGIPYFHIKDVGNNMEFKEKNANGENDIITIESADAKLRTITIEIKHMSKTCHLLCEWLPGTLPKLRMIEVWRQILEDDCVLI
jgi:hypothetical protein